MTIILSSCWRPGLTWTCARSLRERPNRSKFLARKSKTSWTASSSVTATNGSVMPPSVGSSPGRPMPSAGVRSSGPTLQPSFRARNDGWRVGPDDLNPALGIVRHALEPTDGGITEPFVAVTDDEAVQLVFDFLAKNFDLFGLSRSDLAHVQVNPGRQQDDKMMVMRTVQIDSDIPQPGYEQFASLARTWRAGFFLTRAGTPGPVVAAAQALPPPIRLCTQPR